MSEESEDRKRTRRGARDDTVPPDRGIFQLPDDARAGAAGDDVEGFMLGPGKRKRRK